MLDEEQAGAIIYMQYYTHSKVSKKILTCSIPPFDIIREIEEEEFREKEKIVTIAPIETHIIQPTTFHTAKKEAFPKNPLPLIPPQIVVDDSMPMDTFERELSTSNIPRIQSELSLHTSKFNDERLYKERQNKIKDLKDRSHSVKELKFIFNTLSEEFLNSSMHDLLQLFNNAEGTKSEFLNMAFSLASNTLNMMESGKEFENNEMLGYMIRMIKYLNGVYPSILHFIMEYLKVQCPFLIPYFPSKQTHHALYMAIQNHENSFKVILALVANIIEKAFPGYVGNIWITLSSIVNDWSDNPMSVIAASMIVDSFNERGKPISCNYLAIQYKTQLLKLLKKLMKGKHCLHSDQNDSKEWYEKCIANIKDIIKKYQI